jgi:hypothetical protein
MQAPLGCAASCRRMRTSGEQREFGDWPENCSYSPGHPGWPWLHSRCSKGGRVQIPMLEPWQHFRHQMRKQHNAGRLKEASWRRPR